MVQDESETVLVNFSNMELIRIVSVRIMDTILQLCNSATRRMAHNSSPSSTDVMKYSPTDSLKMSNRDNKRIERRKPNWTESENVFLLDQFAMHREILTCKATDASTNLRKQEIWRLICANLNQNNTLVRRTPAEVRRKWKNLVTAAKKEIWEMRHQMHISGGSGTNGRKISELSQRVLQLHSSGNLNNQSNGIYGSLLSAGLLGNAGGGDKYPSKYADYMEDKSFIPAHFTPIITLSESNNNHIISGSHAGDGPPSPMMSDDDEDDQESSDSRNATEFMSDSGVNEQEGMDLRVNVSARNSYASTNSRSGRSHHSGTGSGGHHLRVNLLSRDLGDEDDELLEDDDDIELAMAADKRFANYNGQLSNGGSITGKRDHGHASSLSIANFHHSSALANNTNLSNGPTTTSAVVASAFLERQHLQHLQQLATAASLRPALSTNISNHNNNNQSGHSEETNLNRKCSESTEEISPGGDIFNSIRNVNHASQFMKLKNHFAAAIQESDLLSNLYKERLQLQIEVLKLRKEKLNQELNSANNTPNGVIRPKLFKCGLRLLRRKNMFGYRPTPYRSKLSSSGLRNCIADKVTTNGPSDDIMNKESEINESVDITMPDSVKKESEQECLVNGDSVSKLEEEESAA
ncbi:unnamed protein product [Orchesella dallaii]|uniref:Regulatory protein zeste n=1 Tax=Orchesella dallaii TaxID=48710 RepID=A0ABP1R368_9HEXA